eukprot:SAG31_NODE_5209_length_2674_cov_2.941359_2_plen_126_part_00
MWADLESAWLPRLRAKGRKQSSNSPALPAVTPHRFRLARASTPSPQPQVRNTVSRHEILLDRERLQLQQVLAQTSKLAGETSASVAELDSRHARVKQLQDWREAEGVLLWQQEQTSIADSGHGLL